MAGEFRYPLTRYCLRSGTMTLPQAAVGMFTSGPVKAVDTKTGTELELAFQEPRTVAGLGALYREHKLAVNDELHVKALEDGSFAITAVARPRTPDYTTPEGVAELLDELGRSGLRMTVQEIRAYYDVPEEVDLGAALEADDRFALREGRWLDAAAAAELDAAEAERATRAPAADAARESARSADAARAGAAEGDTATDEARGSEAGAVAAADASGELVGVVAAEAAASAEAALPGAGHGLANAGGVDAAGDQGATATAVHLGAALGPEAPAQPALWTTPEVARGGAPAGGASVGGAVPGGPGGAQARGAGAPLSVHERRAPAAVPPRQRDYAPDEEDEASLEASELVDRLRRVVTPLGFTVEPIARGQVSLVASMGRRGYKVLVQLLSRSERLDWADLLSKRRGLDFRHLAVVGDHQALLRLTGPAELARATLWSWQGLTRVVQLHATVPLSPVDLEPHFERDGLFEEGLARFEAAVAERVAERGALSEVLARLNLLRAPTVFLLEELVAEVGLPRDRVLAIIERLSAAPFSLLARVDHGEFVLRQPVGPALEALSSYALSLKERLPERRVERLTGHGEPLLIADDAEEVDAEDDIGPGGISA